MDGFLREIFDTSFMPHGHCFLWLPEVLWLHVISDTVIGLAYFSIPLTLLYIMRKREHIPFKWVFAMFSAFIFLCGTTHFLAIWVLWVPFYRLEGLVKALTAGASIATALMIIPLIPSFIKALEYSEMLQKKFVDTDKKEVADE